MKRISRNEKECHLSLKDDVFFAICQQGQWEGIYFSRTDLDNNWHAHLPSQAFECKIIGPTNLQDKLVSGIKAKGGNCLKYVARESGEVIFDPASGRLRIEKSTHNSSPTTSSSALSKIHEASCKIKVAIVDDSKTIRSLLRRILEADSQLEVIADFENPKAAIDSILKIKPDVITLDIHMPDMDGVQFLKTLMPQASIPTVMISSISMEEGPMVLNALEAGAVDYIQKPTFDQIASVSPLIIEKIKMAALAKVRNKIMASVQSIQVQDSNIDRNKIVAIGSSTGGTEALRELLTRLPANIPPILIVQHIPAVFSKAFADRMSALCKFPVTEAKDFDTVKPGHCYIAPGGFQMRLERSSSDQWILRIEDTEPVNRHKPSVDHLFDSVAKLCGRKAVGVILTGMGADGAKGLKNMLDAGASTIGQNEESCVVYGMPQMAKKLGAVQSEINLLEIPAAILKQLAIKKAA